MLRGGYMRATSEPAELIVSPGHMWIVFFSKKQFIKQDPVKSDLPPSALFRGFEPFLSKDARLKALSGPESIQNSNAIKIRVSPQNTHVPDRQDFIAFDPKTLLPVGFEISGGRKSATVTYSGLQINPEITSKNFAWSPPAGWFQADATHPRDEPAQEDPSKSSFEPPNPWANLLAVGSMAPQFVLDNARGGKTSFAEELKGKKGLLVNFWFYG
jgi:hypothetical protein